MDTNREIMRVSRNAGGGQVEKGRNFIRLADKVIIEQNNESTGNLIERLVKEHQMTNMEGIWFGSAT
jgi:hypothetical protein